MTRVPAQAETAVCVVVEGCIRSIAESLCARVEQQWGVLCDIQLVEHLPPPRKPGQASTLVYVANVVYILIGRSATVLPELPPFFVCWQVEQATSAYFTDKYRAILQRAQGVWDFSVTTPRLYRHTLLQGGLSIVPFQLPDAEDDTTASQMIKTKAYDILFYGAMNARRYRILDRVAQRYTVCAPGATSSAKHGIHGLQRIAAIRQCRLVLNLHYYEDASLETARLNEVLPFDRLVVSERSSDWFGMLLYQDAVEFIETIDDSLANIESLYVVLDRLLRDPYVYQSKLLQMQRARRHIQQVATGALNVAMTKLQPWRRWPGGNHRPVLHPMTLPVTSISPYDILCPCTYERLPQQFGLLQKCVDATVAPTAIAAGEGAKDPETEKSNRAPTTMVAFWGRSTNPRHHNAARETPQTRICLMPFDLTRDATLIRVCSRTVGGKPHSPPHTISIGHPACQIDVHFDIQYQTLVDYLRSEISLFAQQEWDICVGALDYFTWAAVAGVASMTPATTSPLRFQKVVSLPNGVILYEIGMASTMQEGEDGDEASHRCAVAAHDESFPEPPTVPTDLVTRLSTAGCPEDCDYCAQLLPTCTTADDAARDGAPPPWHDVLRIYHKRLFPAISAWEASRTSPTAASSFWQFLLQRSPQLRIIGTYPFLHSSTCEYKRARLTVSENWIRGLLGEAGKREGNTLR